MPGNVADRWQSRHSGIVFAIRLSVGSVLTWWTSSGTSERPPSVEWHTLDDGHEALLVNSGGFDGGDGSYFANYREDCTRSARSLRPSPATSA
jgi:hypothetical protein